MNLLQAIELLEDSLNNTECEFLKQEIQETQRDLQAVKVNYVHDNCSRNELGSEFGNRSDYSKRAEDANQ